MFADMASQRLNSFFAASPELRLLARQVGILQALQRHYEQIAPSSLKQASRVQQLEGKILTLAADNGAVAAKLRQLVPELTRLFQNKGCEVTGIRVRVQVSAPPGKRAAAPARLNEAARQRLIDSVRQMPDSHLKCALQRLSRRSKNSS